MSSLPRSELAGILFQEIESYLPEIENKIALLMNTSDNQEALSEVHRLFHNIKGAASQVSFAGLSNSAAICEAILASLLESESPATGEQLEFLGTVNAHIKQFCCLDDKSVTAEDNLLAATVSFFQRLHESSGQEDPIVLPSSLQALLSRSVDTENQFDSGQSSLSNELSSLHTECLTILRSVLPLLRELADCSAQSSATTLPVTVLRPIITALSTLAYCTHAAGLTSLEKLLRHFLDILYTFQHNPQATDTCTPVLVQEFISYLDLIFALPPDECEEVVPVVQKQLSKVITSLTDKQTEPDELVFSDLDTLDTDVNSAFTDDTLFQDDSIFGDLSFDDNEFTDEPFTNLVTDATTSDTDSFSDSEETELRELFLMECDEHLAALTRELGSFDLPESEAIQQNDEQRSSFNRMRISAHTLKGAAAMTGHSRISASAYGLERMLRWLEEESQDVTGQDLNVIHDCLVTIHAQSETLAMEGYESPDQDCSFVEEHLAKRQQQDNSDFHAEEIFHDNDISSLTDLQGEDDSASSLHEIDDQFEQIPDSVDSVSFSPLEEVHQEDIITDLTNAATRADNGLTAHDGELNEEELELQEIFQTECTEHLLVINTELNSLISEVQSTRTIETALRDRLAHMRRAIHTLKGAAAMTGFDHLAGCAHALEDLLDWLHDDARDLSPADITIIAEAIDDIETFVRAPQEVTITDTRALARLIEQHLQQRTVTPATVPTDESVLQADTHFEKAPDAPSEDQVALPAEAGNIRVKLHDLEELVNIEGELVVSRGSVEKLLDRFSSTLDELNTIKDTLRRKSQELEVGFEAQSLYGFGPGSPLLAETDDEGTSSPMSEFDPIELDRYSQLNLIIRSLNEISVDVNAIHGEMMALNSSLQGQVAKQQLSMKLMQEKLLRIRMTPLSSISSALFRTVRQTAKQLGKEVQLQVVGKDVLMDRFIWSKTIDPLMHILRNCIDHGIEERSTRQSLNKPATGQITLDATQRGRTVILKISDDGRGVDVARLRQKLIVENVISADSQLSDQDLLSYLFRPSVSTKDDISEISGRGVGLDVVARNIQELRGTVKVINNPGQGVTFELTIPITLSVNRAIVVEVNTHLFAVPIQDIVEVHKFKNDEVIAGETPQVMWHNKPIFIEQLAPYLNLPATTLPEGNSDLLTLVIDTGDNHVAIQIDRIDEQREVVVKDLGSHLRYVKGITGITLTGEGAIIPILNLAELSSGRRPTVAQADSSATISSTAELGPLKVLIVDDSISVRYSLTRLIKSHSWLPHQAVDGIDALEKMESFTPDVIILDIEMPRMNGYEFMATLRNNKELSHISVIMLTSRASEKHRRKAEELGVNHYLTKPFQEDDFIGLLTDFENQR
ncbi:hybrid sensor histidine kinase/response regulator [Desulfopila aestuarii]|uniref:histidine kinase n=1 Tax=Desulfopila aestuarii DSM 18488 TaxID=1121416 RepID=A0A1M7YCB0_9BACT|nr:Hpt domain-containing protein [Desulfopila aestuarii]SHO50274.1 Chemotaxis protein histidine kinase CheA [Desulfopila aestuarii DSM 18488]